jgi:hypothetical protein
MAPYLRVVASIEGVAEILNGSLEQVHRVGKLLVKIGVALAQRPLDALGERLVSLGENVRDPLEVFLGVFLLRR